MNATELPDLPGLPDLPELAPYYTRLITRVCEHWGVSGEEFLKVLADARESPEIMTYWHDAAQSLGLLDPRAEIRRQKVADYMKNNPRELLYFYPENTGTGFIVTFAFRGNEPMEVFISREIYLECIFSGELGPAQ